MNEPKGKQLVIALVEKISVWEKSHMGVEVRFNPQEKKTLDELAPFSTTPKSWIIGGVVMLCEKKFWCRKVSHLMELYDSFDAVIF